MCGIVAVAGGDAVREDRVGAALDALAHRGPDGRGIWWSADRRVALGHVRLAVVDPERGAQPIANEDGSIVAVVNGEIYDDDAHRRWLVARGHVLRSRCDAELLVHLYEELGDDVVTRMRGELAFALWDARRRTLLAGRDRFGIKPLLWTRLPGGGIALASEAKAFFALGVPARWDDESFFHAAHTQYPWPDRTLFAGIHVVEPGCLVRWTDGGGDPVVARYWDLPVRAPRYATLDDAAPALREALDDAVRVRLRADARVCVQLSGGLDSSSVAALAMRAGDTTGACGGLDSSSVAALAMRAGGATGAFTVGFPAADSYDETALAAGTAAALGLPLTVVPVDAVAIAQHWPAAVAHGEGLAINGHLVGKYLLSRAMRDAGFKVALTGEGADELLAGYPHLRTDAGIAITGHTASRGVMLPTGDSLALDGVRARLGCVPTWLAAKATLGARVRRLLAPDLVARWRDVDPYAALADRLASTLPHARPGALAARSLSPLHLGAATWIRSALAHYILRTLGDGMEMAHAIEGRVPFLDPRVADVAFAIAPDILAGAAATLDKPVLRRAVADLVPAPILARPKHPFLAPPLARLAPALVHDTLRTHARTSPLVDGPALVAILDALPAMSDADQQAWDPALMLLLSAAILEARYRA